MSENITRKFDIKYRDEYDVIVIGGGTAGSIAGIAAASKGASTLIIENQSYLGGSATGAQVTPMMSTEISGDPDCSAISKEIKKRMIENNNVSGKNEESNRWFNPEMLKFTLEKMYIENGGEILYDTRLIDTIVKDNDISEIIIHNKSGMQSIKGKVFIDGTGDAEVANLAGAPCLEGPENKKYSSQSVSLRFMMGNIEIDILKNYLEEIGQEGASNSDLLHTAMVWEGNWVLEDIFQQGVDEGVLKYEDGEYFQAFSVPGMPGVLSFNCPEIPDEVNPFNDKDISQSYIKGREMIKRISRFLQEYIPGFKKSYVMAVAPMLGVRESRRIEGEYLLNMQDHNHRAQFDDVIARTAYPVDIHGMDEEEIEIDRYGKGDYMEVPFRSLIPKKINNLLVVGRSISSTFVIQSAIRIQPTCRATGEAAGLGAVNAVRNNIDVRNVDGVKIKEQMQDWGADL